MPQSRRSPARALSRSPEADLLHARVTEHARWLERLCEKYGRPRAEMVRLLDMAPGSFEREVAVLISDAALAKARQMLADREWPDESAPGLFDRAVYGHWRRLRDDQIAQSFAAASEARALLAGERVEFKEE